MDHPVSNNLCSHKKSNVLAGREKAGQLQSREKTMDCNKENLPSHQTKVNLHDQNCHGEVLPFREGPKGRSHHVLIENAVEDFHLAIHEAQKMLLDQMYKLAPDCSRTSPDDDQDLDKLELAICKLDEAKAILDGLSIDVMESKEEKKDSDWRKILADSKKAVTDCMMGVICIAFLGYAVLTSFTMSATVWWMLPLLAVLCMILVLVMGRVTIWAMNRKLSTTKGTLSDILCSTCFAQKFAPEETTNRKESK